MKDDIKYINLIIKEIIDQVDCFQLQDFENERSKFIYIANITTKINLFLNLLKITNYDGDFYNQIYQIMNYNLSRLIEISDHTEDELIKKMQEMANS